jgi:hypothetical protein
MGGGTRLALLAALAACACAAPLPLSLSQPAPLHAAPRHDLADPHHPFDRCPGVTDHLRISAMDFTPDPVKSDATLRVAVQGTLDEDILGGSAKLTVSYYGVPITSVDFDICKQFGITCPRKAGEQFEGVIMYKVPTIPLTGVTLDVEIDVSDKAGKPISCLKTQAKVAD